VRAGPDDTGNGDEHPTEKITVVCADMPGTFARIAGGPVAARARRADGVGLLRRARWSADGGVAVPRRAAAGRRRLGPCDRRTSAHALDGQLGDRGPASPTVHTRIAGASACRRRRRVRRR
jgi:hypothetical protein